MKYLILSIILLITIGCSSRNYETEIPKEFLSLKAPIQVLTCNHFGVLLRDSEGVTILLDPNNYFTKSIIYQNYKTGDYLIKDNITTTIQNEQKNNL
jgi:hypothetical protein